MKQRIISAIFMILITLPIVISGGQTFAIVIGLLGIFALKELLDLKKTQKKIPTIMTCIFYFSLLFIIYLCPFDFASSGVSYSLFSLLIILFLFPTLFSNQKDSYDTTTAFYFFSVTLFLGLACHSLIMVRFQDLSSFLYLVFVALLTDTFAYFIGSFIGCHPLAPVISPKKTWEGSIFGTICATISCSAYYMAIHPSMNLWYVVFFTLLLSIVSQFGDLFFSKIKREYRVKDYSNLIPGHGGILDRFDSLIFVALVYLFFI